MNAVTPHPGAATATRAAGQSVVALCGPMLGGLVRNPATIEEQGLAPLIEVPGTETVYVGAFGTYGCGAFVPLAEAVPRQVPILVGQFGPPEPLYVSLRGPIGIAGEEEEDFPEFDVAPGDFSTDFPATVTLVMSDAEIVLQPGESFAVPANFAGNVWVAAPSAGHRFTAVIFQPATRYPPTPYAGLFPPSGPVTKRDTIPSYLYKQYEDDDDLQALVAAQNRVTQDYVDTFNTLNLPDYTTKSGALLDWVGAGLYGLPRPTFFSGHYRSLGALASYAFGEPPALGILEGLTTFDDVAVTSDDVYKRVLQWHLWRGDGRQVSASWIRRRVVRFLFGEAQQGGANAVSVVSDEGRNLTVTIETGTRRITGGAVFGAMPFGEVPFGTVSTSVTQNAVPALAATLKEGLDSGALEMPGQYAVTCNIGLVGAEPATFEILNLPRLLFNSSGS